ncbi:MULTISPECIES: DUF434 domain-containing protein [Acidianus]|uniref:DUF434 domain-containing protein n=1 Tax=Candidatus Acidianus copahuensis TaxID=1160895 RepID=A0A031LPK2_9CREN|nr:MULTISPECIES: DUF434 domain-containing protein [Acidianus]EZQ06916.1 hypothetical protein CM19_05980 [Candidatus Acidianus copahuensis]NON61440.1 DUF434 domain-containing protein [Acidianus sp. RZ1]
MLLRRDLREAFSDYKYFLNRGYTRKIALEAVTSRYSLSSSEKLLLYRCTHSDKEIQDLRSKIIEHPDEILVDGYNVAITIINARDNDESFLCDDGFVRDLGLGKKKFDKRILDTLFLIAKYATDTKIKCEILLDAQISHSGEIASELRKRGVLANTAKTVDSLLIHSSIPISTNDFLVLNSAKIIYNLTLRVLEKLSVRLVKIPDDI